MSTLQEPNKKLMNKNFVLLWQGQFVSNLGSQAFVVAMVFWLKHATESATLVGILSALSMLPIIILSPLGGVIVDRFPRKKIIVWCDFLRGILVLILALFLYTMPEANFIMIVLFLTFSLLLSSITAFFLPAITASIPDLVPKDKIAGANSFNQASYQVSLFIGQGLGGVLFRILGAPLLFLIDGLTYIFSGISELFITIPNDIPSQNKKISVTLRNFKEDLREGIRYILKNKGLKALVTASAFLNFFSFPMLTLLPFFVENHLQATTDWYGYIFASFGAGSLAGYAIAGTLKINSKARSKLIIGALQIMSFLMIVIGLQTIPVSAAAVMFFIGIFNGIFNIFVMTTLQVTIPQKLRGRVFGILTTISMWLAPIAMALSGVIADLTGQNIPAIYIFSGSFLFLVSILCSLHKRLQGFLSK